jgi:hypothetical protein
LLLTAEMSVDRVGLANRCLDVIAGFTPERAAAQILDGCSRMIGNSR